MRNLRIIEGKNKNKPNYYRIYLKALFKNMEALTNNNDRNLLIKNIYYGVKAIGISKKVHSVENIENLINISFYIKDLIKEITPNELMTIFPIEKTYVGVKWDTKDYFYTMKECKKIGLDNKIGDRVDKLMWDYMNWDITHFIIESISLISDLRRSQGEKGILEEWAKENGIETHTLYEDPNTGNKYLKNYDTGEFVRVKNPTPSYLKLVN